MGVRNSRIVKHVRSIAKASLRMPYRVFNKLTGSKFDRKIRGAVMKKRDVFTFYDNILGKETGFGLKITTKNVPKNSITWVIPDFTANGGGFINIFRMIKMLKGLGFEDQHVVIMEPHRWSSPEEAGELMHAAFNEPGVSISLGADTIKPCQYLFATSWQTAYWVAKYKDAMHKCYFVQDFEPDFYATGDQYYLAENTYRLGLTGVTAGPWLAKKLKDEYGMKTKSFGFSYDKDLYKPTKKRKSENKNIFFYARPVTPRRCFDIGLLALKKVCDEFPDAAVIFAGWDVSDHKIPFKHLNAGALQLSELPDLYSQCELALVLSGTNLSLLPMEVAACGCPLVLNEGKNADWIFTKTEAAYSSMDVDQLAEKMLDLLRNPTKAQKMAKKAKLKAEKSDWLEQGKVVADFLKSLPEVE